MIPPTQGKIDSDPNYAAGRIYNSFLIETGRQTRVRNHQEAS